MASSGSKLQVANRASAVAGCLCTTRRVVAEECMRERDGHCHCGRCCPALVQNYLRKKVIKKDLSKFVLSQLGRWQWAAWITGEVMCVGCGDR